MPCRTRRPCSGSRFCRRFLLPLEGVALRGQTLTGSGAGCSSSPFTSPSWIWNASGSLLERAIEALAKAQREEEEEEEEEEEPAD